MTNLNPNGTGYLVPNQYTNQDLTFVPPPPSQLGPGFDNGGGSGSMTFSVDVEPPPINRPVIIDLAKMLNNKAYTGCYWWKIVLNYSNVGYKQNGKYSRVNGRRQDGALQSEHPWVLCLPTLTTPQASATPPAATVDRITADIFIGTLVLTGYEAGAAHLFRETGTAAPPIIAVTGYVPPAGVSGINAIKTILINGTSYLAICFQASGGGNTVQVLSDLANPPTSSTIPVGANPTYDIIQTAIDGNALLIYRNDGGGNGEIVAIRTDVGVGTVAVSPPRCKIAPGGYGVGLSDAEESDPMAYWVIPIDGNHIQFNNTGAGITFRGRLIKTDVRGYLPVTIDTPLSWVTHATKWRGGILVCDTVNHWYLNKTNPKGKWRRVPVWDEFPTSSVTKYTCCGHYEKAGKLVIETNVVELSGFSAFTIRYAVHFDYDSWTPTQIETSDATAVHGTASRGAIRPPWSPFSDYKYVRCEDSWIRQQVFPIGQDIYDMRHVIGDAAGAGIEFSANDTIVLPAMGIDGLEDCVKILTAVSGPTSGAVATGGTGAYVLVEELLSGLVGAGPNGKGAQFFGTEPEQRIQRHEFKYAAGMAPPWTYQIQPRIQVFRATSGTDATRYTPNAFNNEIAIEGIAVRDPIQAPTARILKALDKLRTRPIP